jgi:hypothetical protein
VPDGKKSLSTVIISDPVIREWKEKDMRKGWKAFTLCRMAAGGLSSAERKRAPIIFLDDHGSGKASLSTGKPNHE